MFPGLTIAYWLTLHGLVTVVAVLLYIVTSHVLQQRRHPTAAIAWVLFMLLMPYVALPAFLTFGSRKQARPRTGARAWSSTGEAPGSWAVQTRSRWASPRRRPTRRCTSTPTAPGAAALRAGPGRRAAIDRPVHLHPRPRRAGQRNRRALCAKARAGVRVRLLLDGMGSLMAGGRT